MLQIYPIYENAYAKDFARLFKDSKSPYKKYLFGTNDLAKNLSEYLCVDGYINTYTKDTEFLGKPILHNLNEIPENSLVLSCVFLGSIIIMRKLSAYRFQSCDCYSFIKASKLPVELFHFTGWKEEIEKNYDKFNSVFERLCDEESKNVFQNLVNFKVSGDTKYLEGFNPPTEEQYFDNCLKLPANPIFADIGGFDGFTSKKFMEHYPDSKKIFLFEPEKKNIEQAKKNLAAFNNVEFIQKGLSCENTTLHFSVNDSASMICEDGEESIEVARLDDLNLGDINFLKMDIEGAEGGAISGAENTIKKYHPNMAICVYHKKDDFWKIPEQVLAIRDDYDLYMRHYTQGSDETVMFFIPRK
ncbi:MAG: FkbM family methyltransferase [Treponema sp.]|nr:FkbM family methyltransferase [Treponema sp.]